MRIYRMTATFGKLENETLTLEPGLNILTAPNEWGKSTWCAFLMAMLYGLDTRAKSTRTALADKERYAPWSGSPMEGRIDLNWNGRDITVQRRTRRRIPLGDFAAFETESGLAVPELTAANCGQMLLGVEQGVYRRAGFIRLTDLPVTEDEALRRRLNALVTTGDESGAADRLAESLRDLKNRCRYNRSGLLPQAEAELTKLEEKIAELEALELQSRKLAERLEELDFQIGRLRNHRQALAWSAAQENIARVSQAETARDRAAELLEQRRDRCARLPSREEAEQKLSDLRLLQNQWTKIQSELEMLPQVPPEPVLPAPFTGLSAQKAQEMADADAEACRSASSASLPTALAVMAAVGLIGAGALAFFQIWLPALCAGAAGLAALLFALRERRARRAALAALEEKYGSLSHALWDAPIVEYRLRRAAYDDALRTYRDAASDMDARSATLRKRRQILCGEQEPEAVMDFWQQVLDDWAQFSDAQQEARQLQDHFDTLSAMVHPVEPPAGEDSLTYTDRQTQLLLTDTLAEQQRLQNRLGQYQGRMEALGNKNALLEQKNRQSQRVARLENSYAALTVAQETLADARAELQRRFAPRIARRAQELMAAMTGGRYRSLTMGADFSLQAGAEGESTLRELMWRSDGTTDQLYLALRLAVAEELTPDAPLVLDDALVRFDDGRMRSAVDILRRMSEDRQILCFTCQARESGV